MNEMRRVLSGLARWLLHPLLERLEAIHHRLESIEARLAVLSGRLDEVEELVQAIGTRASIQTERSLASGESEARTARRIQEIERLLGAATDRP
jgi:type II secretory pathway component PulM